MIYGSEIGFCFFLMKSQSCQKMVKMLINVSLSMNTIRFPCIKEVVNLTRDGISLGFAWDSDQKGAYILKKRQKG